MAKFAKAANRSRNIAASLFASALSLLVSAEGHVALGQSTQIPRVVIGPPGEAALRELFSAPDQWREARRSVGALLYADHNFKAIADAELRTWFAQLSTWGLQLELEVGAIKPWSATGQHTFEVERPIWDRIRGLGGDFASIAMEEPLSATRQFLHKSDDYAIAETAQFVQLVRQHYPNVRIGDIEPFPYFSVAEHMQWIGRLQDALAAKGVRGLDFYRLDPNWVAFSQTGHGSWQEVRAIEQFCKSLHIPFSLIYWASDYPTEQKRHAASDDTWYQGTLKEGYGYSATGLSPDQYVIESWVGAPSHAVPDSDPLSFTGSVLALVRLFVGHRAAH